MLTLLIVLVLVTCTIVIHRPVQTLPARLAREAATARSLFEARTALIAWAVTVSPRAGKNIVPGLLPFPDRNRDGNYDGKGDCVTFGLNDSHLLGRLPWAGDATPCPRMGLGIHVRDGDGEPLWYAVSRNLLTRGRSGPLNPEIGLPSHAVYPWVRVRNAQGALITDFSSGDPLAIAAVIIAPGSALENQNRSGTAPGSREFLDSVRIGSATFDNADADGCPDSEALPCGSPPPGEEFVINAVASAGAGFNDRLAYITVAELMRAVEKRVLGEAAIALTRYRDAFGAYPWLTGFHNPRSRSSFNSTLSANGHLPVHLRDEIFATRFAGAWALADATPTTATSYTGYAGLVPPLADILSGSVHVDRETGRCVWRDWTVGDCRGAVTIPDYYRNDLGVAVTRTIEIFFNIVDETPRVHPPTSGDVRRRSLTANGVSPLISSFHPWQVRITDRHGDQMGQREIMVDADTRAELRLNGIRYDLSIVYDGIVDARDELPEWFAENNWHHFIYAAISRDAVAGGNADGDDNCATPVNTCLILNVAGQTARSDVRALLISSGDQLAGQDRSIGDCDGDGQADDYLCAYFEGENSDRSSAGAEVYARDPPSAVFNDQIRIVEPLPP